MTKFDFRNFPLLSADDRSQLGGVQNSLSDNPKQKRTGLNRLILEDHLNFDRGHYYPLSSDVKLFRKMTKSFDEIPREILPRTGTSLEYLTNALLLPTGWNHHGFDLKNAVAPRLRVTNSGIVIVTHEFDPKTVEQFQEILAWTRSSGKFWLLDRALCEYRDYRGFSIVHNRIIIPCEASRLDLAILSSVFGTMPRAHGFRAPLQDDESLGASSNHRIVLGLICNGHSKRASLCASQK